MTPKQFERMAKCDHRKTCGRLVTLKASSYADPYYWCLCDECPYYTTENAKLRELVAGIGHLLFALDVDYCATCPRDGINHPCPVYTVDGGECLYKTDLRKLGVEVNE